MARNKDNENTETTTDSGSTDAPVAKQDKRRIILQPNGDVPSLTEATPRADYIRTLWGTGQYTRREITDFVSKAQGEEVAYQIIFQATKGVEGGPAPKTAEAAGGESGGEQAAAAE